MILLALFFLPAFLKYKVWAASRIGFDKYPVLRWVYLFLGLASMAMFDLAWLNKPE